MTHHLASLSQPVASAQNPIGSDTGTGPIVFAVLIALLATVAVPLAVGPMPEAGLFIGPDSYTRMTRVRDLLETGLHGPALERVLADSAIDHHWTRLLDLLIAGIAVALAATGMVAAPVDWAGGVIGPILLVVGLVVSVRVLRPTLSEGTLLVLVATVACTPVVSQEFRLMRADHHGLELALALIMLSLLVRVVQEGERARPWLAWGAGSVAGLLAWGIPSGILHGAAAVAALAVLWLVYGGAHARYGARMAAGACATILIALPVERGLDPADLIVLDPDRLSLVHLGIFALLTVGLAAADRTTRLFGSRPATRLAFSVAAAAAGLATLAALLPNLILHGQLIGGVDPYYAENRLVNIDEYQGVLYFMTEDTARFLGYVVPYALAGVALMAGIASYPGRRRVLIVLGIALIGATVFYAASGGGFKARHLVTTMMPALLIIAIVSGAWADWIGAAGSKARTALATGVRIAAASASVAVVGLVGLTGNSLAVPTTTESKNAPECKTREIVGQLRSLVTGDSEPALILASPELSANIMYATDHRVFAIPTHRWQPGFRPMLEILRSSDHAAAVARMRALGTDALVVCARNKLPYQAGPDSLWAELSAGRTPKGLTRLSPTNRGDKIYRVIDTPHD